MISTKKQKPKGVPILMDLITLIQVLVSGLLNAQEEFLEHLDRFSTFEETVNGLTDQVAADFIGLTLTAADTLIRESGKRKASYTVQRSRNRTLISGVGDITFTHTLYKDSEGKIRCLLDELLHLPNRERFTPVAEAKVLSEAEVHSYQHAAESVQTKGQTINASIGQGLDNFSPLQMAKYVAMIANGGQNLEVTLIKSITNADGTEVPKDEVEAYVNEKLGVSGNSGSDINISDENLQAIKEGMKGVTSDGSGTAYTYFRDFDIEVGGKTGSASTDDNGNANAWFVGFAPFDDPEIAVAVYIKDGQHGASTAVTARDIFAQYFGMNSEQITEDMTATSDMQTVR